MAGDGDHEEGSGQALRKMQHCLVSKDKERGYQKTFKNI